MNKNAIIFTVMIICSSINLAEAVTGVGAGTSSCGEWVQDRKNGDWHPKMHWVQGFLSAYNVLAYRGNNPHGINIDYKAIAVWLDNYCGKNPLSSPAEAMPELISELSK